MSEWPIRPLRALADADLGRQRSPQHEQGPHMVPYLRAANVSDGRLNLDDVKEMNFSPDEQRIFSLAPGDVLVTEGSGSLRSVGAAAGWQGEIPGPVCFQNTLIRLRPKDGKTDPRYLAWWARAAFTDGLFAAIASGANIFHLSAERVRSLPLQSPPLERQRDIADYLEIETDRIDQIIAKKLQLVTLMRERAIAAIASDFSPSVGFSALGVPQSVGEFRMVRLGAVSAVQSGITLDDGRGLDETAVTHPYLRVANVQDGRLDLTEVKEVRVPPALAARCLLADGDVLLTEGGDLDKLGRGTVWHAELPDCLHQNHVFAVRPAKTLLPDFLSLLTRTPYARAYFEMTASKTTGIASTSSTKIASFRVPLPSIDEQQSIIARAEDRLARLSSAIESIERQAGLLKEHRQALITTTVMGTHLRV